MNILNLPNLKNDKNNKFLIELVKNINKTFTDIYSKINNSSSISTSSYTDYYKQPSNAGTGTANEVQIFVNKKIIPIQIVPYDLSSTNWRVNFITSWNYREDLKQTQVLFIATDPSSVVNCIGIPLD